MFEIVNAGPGADGSSFLPDAASVEPGSLIHELYEVWQWEVGGARSESHSFENLQAWLKERGVKIASLQHKLKGRLPIRLPAEREGLEALLSVMLTHWDCDAVGSSERPVWHPVLNSKTSEDVAQIVGDLVSKLAGPIYGVTRDEITITKSPGINTATFMRQHAHDAAIMIPVIDRAMYGVDATSALDGARLSLSHCLGPDSSVCVAWILKPEVQRDNLNYVKYLYERSFLVTLFRLIELACDKRWQPQFAPWDELKNRLFVCVAPDAATLAAAKLDGPESEYGPLIVDDFLPTKAPELWKPDGEKIDFGKFSFVVTASDPDRTLSYWLHTKEAIPAFTPLRSRVEATMQHAHSLLVDTILGRHSREDGATLPGWKVVSAVEFIQGDDLRPSSI